MAYEPFELRNELIALVFITNIDDLIAELQAIIPEIDPLFIENAALIKPKLSDMAARLIADPYILTAEESYATIMECCDLVPDVHDLRQLDNPLIMSLIRLATEFAEQAKQSANLAEQKQTMTITLEKPWLNGLLDKVRHTKNLAGIDREEITAALNQLLIEINKSNTNQQVITIDPATIERWSNMAAKIVELMPDYKKTLINKPLQKIKKSGNKDYLSTPSINIKNDKNQVLRAYHNDKYFKGTPATPVSEGAIGARKPMPVSIKAIAYFEVLIEDTLEDLDQLYINLIVNKNWDAATKEKIHDLVYLAHANPEPKLPEYITDNPALVEQHKRITAALDNLLNVSIDALNNPINDSDKIKTANVAAKVEINAVNEIIHAMERVKCMPPAPNKRRN